MSRIGCSLSQSQPLVRSKLLLCLNYNKYSFSFTPLFSAVALALCQEQYFVIPISYCMQNTGDTIIFIT